MPYSLNNRMSRSMWRTLEYIATHDVHVEHLRQFNQGTIRYLAAPPRRYIHRRGTLIELTAEGRKAHEAWRNGDPNWRSERMKQEPVTEVVDRVLALSRLRVMPKSA